MLMALVHSVIRRLPNSSYPIRKNPWQDTWVKWNLLKFREGKYKGKHVQAQIEAGSQELDFSHIYNYIIWQIFFFLVIILSLISISCCIA
jgi:hypothetical protein